MTAQQPTLLILAASIYQLPFIRAARAAGCRVLTADNRPTNPGHALADASFNCDVRDVVALVELAQAEKVDGVVAAASDVALDAAAAIAQALGLAGPSVECVRVLTRKSAFRSLQVRLGLPHPRNTGSLEQVDFPPPWIVKPNRASGSRGIRIVKRMDELVFAWVEATAQSLDEGALVEAFVEGIQGTVEGVMANGRITSCLITDRLTVSPPWVATRAHRVPTTLPRAAVDKLSMQIEQVFAELGYSEGPFDGDVLVQPDGTPMLIELTPRAGGNSLVRMLECAVDFDMPAYVVATSLRRAAASMSVTPRPTVVEILGVDGNGLLDYDAREVASLAREQDILYLCMDHVPGTHVARFTNGRQRVGELVVTADTPAQLDGRLADAHRRIALGVTDDEQGDASAFNADLPLITEVIEEPC